MKPILALGIAAAVSSLASCSSNPKPASMPAPRTPSPTPAPMVMAQAPSTIFQPSRLMASRDSFIALAGGQPLGTAVLSLAREGGNFRYVVDIALMAVNVRQHYESVFDATTLMPGLQTMTGNIQGTPINSRIVVADGRAKGTAMDPGPMGITTSNVDLPVPPGTVDDQAGLALVASLDLAEGFKTSYMSLGDSPTAVRSNQVTVQGKETVTVPAGTFETYRVLIHAKNDVVMFATTAMPRRIVMVRVENGAVELRLMK